MTAHTPTRPLPATDTLGTVIAGRLDDPRFAAVARGFFDAMCGGPVRYGPPAPKREYDHTVSKEENLRRVFAGVDAAFAKGKGQ